MSPKKHPTWMSLSFGSSCIIHLLICLLIYFHIKKVHVLPELSAPQKKEKLYTLVDQLPAPVIPKTVPPHHQLPKKELIIPHLGNSHHQTTGLAPQEPDHISQEPQLIPQKEEIVQKPTSSPTISKKISTPPDHNAVVNLSAQEQTNSSTAVNEHTSDNSPTTTRTQKVRSGAAGLFKSPSKNLPTLIQAELQDRRTQTVVQEQTNKTNPQEQLALKALIHSFGYAFNQLLLEEQFYKRIPQEEAPDQMLHYTISCSTTGTVRVVSMPENSTHSTYALYIKELFEKTTCTNKLGQEFTFPVTVHPKDIASYHGKPLTLTIS